MKTSQVTTDSETVHETVRDGYRKIAEDTSAGCCGQGVSCCGSSPKDSATLARELGYSVEELQALPEGANMGLSCGNPAALAALSPGEVVLDLGSGGGFDVFIAGRKVGPTGRAIGVDMTAEMLSKARRNAVSYREQSGLDNVEFRLGEIEHLPLADACVDVVISNCVINLSPDKAQVWREMARVLKPGGRVAISDMALLKPLPEEVLKLVSALVGCVAGAVLVGETERMAGEAGLRQIVLSSKPQYVEAMTSFEDPLYQKIVEVLPAGTKPAEYLASLEIRAEKPASTFTYSNEVDELVSIGAAIGANCEPCLKHHYHQARQLGLATPDIAKAIEMAVKVKDSPHQSTLRLASRLTGIEFAAAVDPADPCCGPDDASPEGGARKCCH